MVGTFDSHDLRARHARTLIQVADELGDRLVNTAWVRERAKWRDRHADILGADALYDFHDYIQERIEQMRVRESEPRWWSFGRPRRPHTTDLLISAEALLLRADELLEP